MENSQYNIIHNVRIMGGYSFTLKKDSSFILQNFYVNVSSKEIGNVEYTIDLAYILSFGDNINKINFYNYLENLVFYSLNLWRPS
jgi:hypothetical protein